MEYLILSVTVILGGIAMAILQVLLKVEITGNKIAVITVRVAHIVFGAALWVVTNIALH